MTLEDAAKRAEELRKDLDPFCIPGSLVVAGSVRRRKFHPGDIELVGTPDLCDYDKVDGIIKLLASGRYGTVKTGMFPARQTTLEGGLGKIEIYWQSKQSYGLNLWIRTGPAEYVQRGLSFWKRVTNGGFSLGAQLHLPDNTRVETLTERSVFEALDKYARRFADENKSRYVPVKWVDPWDRK